MEMIIHLDSDIFDLVDREIKCIEVRVNDEKRRKLQIGDELVFLKRPNDDESIRAVVENLEYYENFVKLIENYSIEEMYLRGYTKEQFLELLKRFYTDEEQKKYGVVAIRFKKI